MGLFSRNQQAAEAITVVDQPTLIEQPTISADELEKMVYSTYQEKLELQRQLDKANERIKVLKEQETKLRAAETFSRQSEEERHRADAKNEDLQRRNKSLEDQLKQARAKATTLEIKVKELQDASSGQMAAYRRELIEEMQRQAVCATGGWSKNRVLDFLASFLPGVEVLRDFTGTVVGTREIDEEPRRATKKTHRGTDTHKTPKYGHSDRESDEYGEIMAADESR